MRALILLLPLTLALAADPAPLQSAAKQWASDSAEERDAASRAVVLHLNRELAPIVAAMRSPDPEVRHRARAALEALLPPRPPEPPAPEPQPQWGGGRAFIKQAGGQNVRFVLNAQGQMILMHDQGEMEQLKAKGITGMPVADPVMRDQLGLARGRGFAVAAVDRRSEAERLGIQAMDILISMDGRPVMQSEEVLKGLAARSPEIKLLRRGKLITLGKKEEGVPAGEGK
jgi:hypothetical protein